MIKHAVTLSLLTAQRNRKILKIALKCAGFCCCSCCCLFVCFLYVFVCLFVCFVVCLFLGGCVFLLLLLLFSELFLGAISYPASCGQGQIHKNHVMFPKACVPSPLLYLLYIDDCRSNQENSYLVKFASHGNSGNY